MGKKISIGNQGFEKIRENQYFYIDKTDFVREWWESGDEVTLITRPRRFGKTLNMDMLKCFFSNKYRGRADLFEGLSIWKKEKYRRLQGSYPMIFLSFADIKQNNYKDATCAVKDVISDVFRGYREILKSDKFSDADCNNFNKINSSMDDVTAQRALKELGYYLQQYYGKKVIILLDEYDTPMQEAYVHGYWEEFTGFLRSLFNSTFKTNPYMERAIMTGITRVLKDMSYPCQGYDLRPHQRASFFESVFSDLNNLNVVTTTSDEYATCFGFTEEEVFLSLEEYGMNGHKEKVRKWYDGFVFGNHRDIYNPWSITNFLDKGEYRAYWTSTSSNGMVSSLIQTASSEVKSKMEELLQGREIIEHFDEQIVFSQLYKDESAIWSLLMAAGYLKAERVEYRGETMKPWYHLRITNLETKDMFETLFVGWFKTVNREYNEFVRALLAGNKKEMTDYLNDVALETFSSFDTGTRISKRTQPERFYHGFVLGLLVTLREEYQIKSNRESGYGRYDVMLIPKKQGDVAMVLEFKIYNSEEEEGLKETVQAAIRQIEEKNYDAELLHLGIRKENIRHYGFAFEGKKVLIG